jgi:hypothetical protein
VRGGVLDCSTRVNPLAGGPAEVAGEPMERQVLRRAELLCSLVATVLDRPLTQLEDAAMFAVVESLLVADALGEPTLGDVASLLASPDEDLRARLRTDAEHLSNDLAPLVFGLDKLLSRSLRGMFDGPSTVSLRWDGPGVLLDLSAVPLDSEALPLVMVAATGWLQQLMACPGPQRVQVLDEAW